MNPRPGVWTGWLVLDPWGSMYMYNHCHLWPVNQTLVPALKKYANKPVLLEVKRTYCLDEPGPVRIDEAFFRSSAELGELRALSLTLDLEEPTSTNSAAAARLTITNTSHKNARFIAAQLTLLVLVKGEPSLFTATNGESYPHNRYQSRWVSSFDKPRQVGRVRMGNQTRYETLTPREQYACIVDLKLSVGEYYVWGGYGAPNFFGPVSLMSTGVLFEVKEQARVRHEANTEPSAGGNAR